MFSNSCVVTRRPGALTVNVKAWSGGAGDAPIRPAGAWRFCSLIAEMTSAGVMASFASLSGRSQMRRPYSVPPKRSACAIPGILRIWSRMLIEA